MQGLFNCSPWDLVLREPARLPTQGLAPSPLRPSSFWGCPQCRLVQIRDPCACWQSGGWESKCLGSSPCLPHSTRCKAGSAAFTLRHSPHNTLMGIHPQAPASVSTAHRQDPRLLPGRLTPQLFPKASRMRGQVRGHRGGRGEPPKRTQACLANLLWLRPQQRDRSHLLPSPSLSAVPAASSTPLTWRGCCK